MGAESAGLALAEWHLVALYLPNGLLLYRGLRCLNNCEERIRVLLAPFQFRGYHPLGQEVGVGVDMARH